MQLHRAVKNLIISPTPGDMPKDTDTPAFSNLNFSMIAAILNVTPKFIKRLHPGAFFFDYVVT
jgi:hypothetical protein